MRRTLALVLFATVALQTDDARAAQFMDWWLTSDQQGRLQFERGDYQTAARAFEDPLWKAIAFYRAGDFATAATWFGKIKSPEGYFRLGNALARQERLAAAMETYRMALSLRPDFAEAKFNLEWVTGLWELDQKEYDDAGGTGGKLGADRVVTDERGARATGVVSAQTLRQEAGLSDAQLRDMWMRRVETTPGDFLKLKFSYQLQAGEPDQSGETTELPQ